MCATDGLGPHLEKRRKGGGDVSTCPSIARSRSHAPSAAPPPSSHRPTQKKSFERRTFLRGSGEVSGAGVRPPTEIARRHSFSTTPSRVRSATVERPAPIARQRACGAQRKAEESATAAPHPLPFCRRCARVAASLPAGGWLRAPFRPPCPYGCVHARTHARVGTRIRTREELCQVRFIWDFLSVPDMPLCAPIRVLLTRRAKPVGLRVERRSRETSMRP